MADDKTLGRSLAPGPGPGPAPGAEREAGRPDQPGHAPALAREEPVGDAAVPRLELASWRERFGIVAGITTRGRDFSLGLWSEEPVAHVMTRWRAVRTTFRPRFPGLVLAHQVHGTSVAWHAGGRGTAGGILARGVELLARHAAVGPADIIMHCGVGICGACYEVGSEVLDQLGPTPAAIGPGVRAGPRGSAHADLRALLAGQAAALGLGAVSVSPWCSAHDRAQFFSHRASGGRDGRMIAYLGLPLA